MVTRISELFSRKDKEVLSIYFTAGFPKLADTDKILSSLCRGGADMIEIGMPYSDPLADGPVIQNSSMHALQNGMSINVLFEQLEEFNKTATIDCKKTPLILMGYLNPVLQFGFEKFCTTASSLGIDGIILPDLPIAEYEREYKHILDQNGLSFIFLITPETSEERIRKIDDLSTGFIYAVSSSSITGSATDIEAQQNYFERIKSMNLKSNVLIGFGIRDRHTFSAACKFAAGAIIGTAYINAIAQSDNIEKSTVSFLNSILDKE